MASAQALLEPKTLARHNGTRAAAPSSQSLPGDRWERRLDDLRAFQAEYGHCNVPQKYEPDRSLAVWVNNCRRLRKMGKLSEERVRNLDDLGFCWSLRTRRVGRRDWDAMMAELLEFKKCHGHCNVPRNWPENQELACWLHGVRCSNRSGGLDPQRVRQLDELGLVWEPEQNRWEEMLDELKTYNGQHGDCNVPGTFTGNPKLAKWVAGLRASRKNNTLEPDRVSQLEALGFVWDRGGEQRWEDMYAELAEYRRQHGHCRVSSLSPEYQKLGNWVRTQRTRHRQGELRQDQIRRLDELGFTWELWREQWDAMFAELVQYKAAYGHCDVPQAWEENRKLGNWVITQRTYYKKGRLDGEQIERLNALGFHWSVAGDRITVTAPAAPRPDTRRRRAA
jgi:hypothetical protein